MDILPALGRTQELPPGYAADLARVKRFLERWTLDRAFQARYAEDPAGAVAETGLPLTPELLRPFLDDETAKAYNQDLREGRDADWPLAVRRYKAFYREKRRHREWIRGEARPADARFAAWRARQINRCVGTLGRAKANALVHAPASFELSKGCSVGCWFCGVAAGRFEAAWPYTFENRRTWRDTLAVLREVVGDAARHSFCYWATDPLDNPEYERFLLDFHEILGRWPQTTTALAGKDLERTRALLHLGRSKGAEVDRFSILSLKTLMRIHEFFPAEELLGVECIPQNPEADDKYVKAMAGRARRYAEDPKKPTMPPEDASTIACVSGFLFNMLDRRVRLVTPCQADERFPLGFWTLEEGTFTTREDLRALLLGMIDRHMAMRPDLAKPLRLRKDLRWSAEDGVLTLSSRTLHCHFRHQERLDDLGRRLAEGLHTGAELADQRERDFGIPQEETCWFLLDLFHKGLLDEEPQR